MKLLNSLLAASAVLAAGATSLIAQSSTGQINANNTIPSTTTDWGVFYTDVFSDTYGNGTAENLNFPLFNSSLGTLTEVELSFTNLLTTTLFVTNNGASTAKGKVFTQIATVVQDPDGYFAANEGIPEFAVNSVKFTFSVAPGNHVQDGPVGGNGINFASFVFTSSQVLSEFVGPGTINLSASTYTQTEESGVNGNIAAGQTAAAGFVGAVTYLCTPTPVPEPSTLGLLALGLTALPFLRRKRQ